MIGALRLLVFGFLGLSVVYWAVSLYSRSVCRERLENDWAEEHPGEEESPERNAFIEEGMIRYQSGLRRKLILLVYIIPAVLVVVAVVVTNAN
jgi:hypothetical protein